MPGAEISACEAFLRSRLTGLPALVSAVPGGFHSERQHTAAAGRYVLYQQQGTLPDVTGEQGVRILVKPLFLVSVIDKVGTFGSLVTASRLIDSVLHMAPPQSIIVDGQNYTIQSCLRERAYSRVEPFIDLEWRYLGGYYRIQVSPY